MTDEELLEPFDDDVLRAVADASDVELDRLRDAVADHQQTMRTNPGVEDLVYEWRKQYDDPILERDSATFVVAVPPTVWEEYRSYLDFEDGLWGAVVAVHQEQTVRTDDVDLSGMADGDTALVAGRER